MPGPTSTPPRRRNLQETAVETVRSDAYERCVMDGEENGFAARESASDATDGFHTHERRPGRECPTQESRGGTFAFLEARSVATAARFAAWMEMSVDAFSAFWHV